LGSGLTYRLKVAPSDKSQEVMPDPRPGLTPGEKSDTRDAPFAAVNPTIS
jgi:hypothetical protein